MGGRIFFIRSIAMLILLTLRSDFVDARDLNHLLRHYLHLNSKPSNAMAFHHALLTGEQGRPDASDAQNHDNRIKATQSQPEDFLFVFDKERVFIHGGNSLEDGLPTNRLDHDPTSKPSADRVAGTAEENNLNLLLDANNDEAAMANGNKNLTFPNRNIITAPQICAEGERADSKGRCKLVIM